MAYIISARPKNRRDVSAFGREEAHERAVYLVANTQMAMLFAS